MDGTAARGGVALLDLSSVRPVSAPPRRAHARARSGTVRTHPSRTGCGTRATARALLEAAVAIAARDIAFTRYDARRGGAWLLESYRMFSKHRLSWIAMLLAYYVALLFVDFIPLIGILVAPMIK